MDPIALYPGSIEEVSDEVARRLFPKLLETLPEAIRRSRYGVYMDESEVCRELSISPRALRYLRETRRLSYSRVGKTIRYKAADVFGYLDAGRVPARPDRAAST